MNKSKYFSVLFFALGLSLIFSCAVQAQNNGNHHNNRGGRPGNNERHYTQTPNYGSAANGNRMYSYHPSYHQNYYPVYHPSYGYSRGYSYYPHYYYRPVYRSPYVYPHYGPAFGIRISILPFGYYPFYIGNDPFYYYQGIYYRPYSAGGYEVIAPPLGATVKHLPSGAKATVINGQKYYELGGTFYQEQITAKNKLQYVVVGTDGVINTVEQNEPQPENMPVPNDAPELQAPGTTLNQLPADSKAVVINQQKYYMAPSGVYYQEVIDANNNVGYKVVGSDETITNGN